MSTIYSINDWENNVTYKKHSVVKNGPYYYYAISPHTSPAVGSFSDIYTYINNYLNLWGGITLDENGAINSKFIWIPSYNSSTNSQPKIKLIKFGDGYEQRIKDGINNYLLDLDLSFENRNLEEVTAILHFLYTRQAKESFLFTPLSPYATQKKFVCRAWSDSQTFYNNYTVRAKFEEVAN